MATAHGCLLQLPRALSVVDVNKIYTSNRRTRTVGLQLMKLALCLLSYAAIALDLISRRAVTRTIALDVIDAP